MNERACATCTVLYTDPRLWVDSACGWIRLQVVRYHTVERRAVPIPELMVQGNPLVRVRRDQALYVKADIAVPQAGPANCTVGRPEMTYQWRFDPAYPLGGAFALDERTQHSKNLFISPMSLNAGEIYHLIVVGTIVGEEDVYNMAMATVKCDFSDLQVKKLPWAIHSA